MTKRANGMGLQPQGRKAADYHYTLQYTGHAGCAWVVFSYLDWFLVAPFSSTDGFNPRHSKMQRASLQTAS